MTDKDAAELLDLLRIYVAEYPDMAQQDTAAVISDLEDSISGFSSPRENGGETK